MKIKIKNMTLCENEKRNRIAARPEAKAWVRMDPGLPARVTAGPVAGVEGRGG